MAWPTSPTTPVNTDACLVPTSNVVALLHDLVFSNQVVEAVESEPSESIWDLELYHHPTDDWTSIAPGVQVRKNGDGIVVRVLKNS
ncbi:MAG TPA: hypothetical protein VLG36_05700 [Candidatus Chromulinivoraceae bacterium]|nr:hypothetical protein [Candidatus Chromulinivoraceae bacterium]